MLELTKEQIQAVEEHPGRAVVLMDPATQQTFMLVPRQLYESWTEYDDSLWTDEEMDLLAGEIEDMLDDDMTVEDSGT